MKIFHERIGLLDSDEKEIYYAHERHKKDDHCSWCEMVRLVHIRREFLYRLENCGVPVHHLSMWSLGSSLKSTSYNRKIIIRDWHLFRARMSKLTSWVPVFRILEEGKRGYLHIHFIAISYLKHAVVMRAWRDIRGESCNVHVSGQKGKQDPLRLASYLLKYLTKEGSGYRWMGPFYGMARERSRRVRQGSDIRLHYGGIVYGGFESEVLEIPQYDAQMNFDEFGIPPEGVNTNGK